MQVIAKPRGGGKTYNMVIKLRSESNALAIMLNEARARTARLSYPDIANRILSYDQAQTMAISGYSGPIWIDDVDDFLYKLFPHNNIAGFTVTGQMETEWDR